MSAGQVCANQCGCEITVTDSATLASPNYPSNYDHDSNCVYKFTAANSADTLRVRFGAFKVCLGFAVLCLPERIIVQKFH